MKFHSLVSFPNFFTKWTNFVSKFLCYSRWHDSIRTMEEIEACVYLGKKWHIWMSWPWIVRLHCWSFLWNYKEVGIVNSSFWHWCLGEKWAHWDIYSNTKTIRHASIHNYKYIHIHSYKYIHIHSYGLHIILWTT